MKGQALSSDSEVQYPTNAFHSEEVYFKHKDRKQERELHQQEIKNKKSAHI